MTTTTILSDNGASSGSAGIKTTGGNDGTLALQTTTSGGTATTGLTINTVQGVYVPNTIGVGGATPAASGAGITFPASQSASSDANTLDDYEEGIWTPTITATSGSGTYNNRIGNYVKVGKLVVVNFWVYGSGRGTLSGTATVTGLPFPVTSAAESRPASYLRSNSISITGVVEGWGPAGTSYISLEAASNGTSTPLSSASISAGTFEIGGSFSYITDN